MLLPEIGVVEGCSTCVRTAYQEHESPASVIKRTLPRYSQSCENCESPIERYARDLFFAHADDRLGSAYTQIVHDSVVLCDVSFTLECYENAKECKPQSS